jgi:hypothetical protein
VTENNDYLVKVTVYFKVSIIIKKIIDFSVKVPFHSEKCVCKNFNVVGIVKASFCFCFEEKCLYFKYDINAAVGHWTNKIKLTCL